MAKTSNDRLHDCVVQMMELEDMLLMEEMKHAQPHVFPKEFEQKMQEVMRVQARVSKRSDLVRYLATAAVVILMVFGLLFIGNEDLRASDFKINILEWFEDFFVVENDTNRDKDDESDVLFHESQIGYIPEGFEKVAEDVSHSKVIYKYKNDRREFINISVYRSKTSAGIDNEESEQDVQINKGGFEYRYVYKEGSGEHIYTWTDGVGKFYVLSAWIELEEAEKVMNGIYY